MESSHRFHLFIVCLAAFLGRSLANSEGDLRLVNGTALYGRLEIYYNSTWMTISNKNIRGSPSRVACRQLGLPFTEAEFVRDKRILTPSDSEKVLVTWMICRGGEDRLTECNSFEWNPVPFYTHDEDFAIFCKGEFFPTGGLRLTDGSDHRRGRLELYSGLRWTPFCLVGFQVKEAVVACRQLGFNASQPYIYNSDYFGPPTGALSSLYIAQCTGDEEDIPSCDELYTAYSSEDCSVSQDSLSICCSRDLDSCKPKVEMSNGEFAGSLLAVILLPMALCAGCYIACKKPCSRRCRKKPKPPQQYNAVSLGADGGGPNQFPMASSEDQKVPVYIHTNADGAPVSSCDPSGLSPPAPAASNTPYPPQSNLYSVGQVPPPAAAGCTPYPSQHPYPYHSGQAPPPAGVYPTPPLQPGYNPTAATGTYPAAPYPPQAASTGPA